MAYKQVYTIQEQNEILREGGEQKVLMGIIFGKNRSHVGKAFWVF